MKQIIKLEEALTTALCIYFIYSLHMGFSWWLYILLFLSPDISMVGYLAGKSVGAITYNLFHHRGLAASIALAGLLTGNTYLVFTGAILFAHSSFDRMMGYGLKYFKGFKYTHLGKI